MKLIIFGSEILALFAAANISFASFASGEERTSKDPGFTTQYLWTMPEPQPGHLNDSDRMVVPYAQAILELGKIQNDWNKIFGKRSDAQMIRQELTQLALENKDPALQPVLAQAVRLAETWDQLKSYITKNYHDPANETFEEIVWGKIAVRGTLVKAAEELRDQIAKCRDMFDIYADSQGYKITNFEERFKVPIIGKAIGSLINASADGFRVLEHFEYWVSRVHGFGRDGAGNNVLYLDAADGSPTRRNYLLEKMRGQGAEDILAHNDKITPAVETSVPVNVSGQSFSRRTTAGLGLGGVALTAGGVALGYWWKSHSDKKKSASGSQSAR